MSSGIPTARLPTLTIEQYDRREDEARVRASYPALRSFAPVSFGQVGFPTRITRESELRRYADIMYEIANRPHWLDVEQWSPAEIALMRELRSEIEAMTAAHFGRPVQAFMCLFPPMPIVRLIDALAKAAGGKPLRVLEIGPGSGFLAAYLLLRGHRYIGIDNTQALYLWQHRLLRWLTDGEVEEFALSDTPPKANPTARAALLPWWHFSELFRAPPFEVDVVVCEAAIGEMDPFGARYVIRLAKSFVERSPTGVFLYQNLGEQRHNTTATVEHLFANVNGYRKFVCGSVTAHAVGSAATDKVLSGLAGGPPRLDDGMSGPLRTAREALPVDPAKIMDSYAFFDYLRLEQG